jgi:hypothetical protein
VRSRIAAAIRVFVALNRRAPAFAGLPARPALMRWRRLMVRARSRFALPDRAAIRRMRQGVG